MSLRSESVDLPSYFRGIKEVERQLDPTNIKILSAMWKFGPRNLLEVSRRTGIPFTSVYHRVSKLESRSGRVAYLIPQLSGLGMVRVVVLTAARPGYQEPVAAALKIPNLWRFINPTEGMFTHLSVHAVPIRSLKDFRKYIQKLVEVGLIDKYRIILTGDYVPNFPNFRYYDTDLHRWTFEWQRWLTALKKTKPVANVEDPKGYRLSVGKKDVLIVKELERNARRSFAEMAPLLGITLQGVKYHYDRRLVRAGIVRYFDFDVYPYPVEVSAYHEVMLEFSSNKVMNRFFFVLPQLFFAVGSAKVLKEHTLIIRTYIPGSQLPNMYAFFSELAKARLLTSYSPIRMTFQGRQAQTISYELFDDKTGWLFSLPSCVAKLSKLVSATRAIMSTKSSKKSNRFQ